MVAYADFHVLVATLAPVFLFASLVAHYRYAREENAPRLIFWAWFLLVAQVWLTIIQIWDSLEVLSGVTEGTRTLRKSQSGRVLWQLLFAVLVLVWDEGHKRWRR